MKNVTIPPKPYTFRFFGKDLGLPWLHTLFLCDYRSAMRGAWHWHDHVELVCRLKGELDYEFKRHPPLTLHPGHAIVIPANEVHRLSDEVDSPGLRICLLLASGVRKFPPGIIPSLPAFRQLLRLLTERAFVPFPIPEPLQERMLRLVELAGRDNLTEDPLTCARFRFIVTDILMTLAAASKPTRTPHSQVIDQAKSYLAVRLGEKVRMRELLDYIGYGQSQFFRLFRSNTGLTPNEWLCRKRIVKACELLSETSDNVREIAARTGFPDASYFCRVFRHRIGQTPLAYRATHQKTTTAQGRIATLSPAASRLP